MNSNRILTFLEMLFPMLVLAILVVYFAPEGF